MVAPRTRSGDYVEFCLLADDLHRFEEAVLCQERVDLRSQRFRKYYD